MYAETVHITAGQFPGLGWRRHDEQFGNGPIPVLGCSWTLNCGSLKQLKQLHSRNYIAYSVPGAQGQKEGFCFGFKALEAATFLHVNVLLLEMAPRSEIDTLRQGTRV